MGEMDVPADALYGASTQRAVLNFPISGQRFPRRFIRALALIKEAAAETNAELGLLTTDVAAAIAAAAARGRRRRPRRPVPDRHLPDRLRDVDEHEHERGRRAARGGPAGRRADGPPERRRQPLPVARTTRSRRALQLAAAMAIEEDLLPALETLRAALDAKADELWPVVKTGRTHLQDATPIRLGQEFRGYAGQLEESIRRAGPPRPSCSRSRSAGRPSAPGSTPIPITPPGPCARLSA